MEQETALQTGHKRWLSDPITQATIRAIGEHREKFITYLSKHCSNTSVPDSQYRLYGAALQTLDVVKSIIDNPEKLNLTRSEEAKLDN